VVRILFLHGVSDFYGASRCLVRLAAALKRDGHEVEVWIPETGPIVPMLVSSGVECVVTPELRGITRGVYRRKRSLIRFLFKNGADVLPLARKIRSFRPDVVHTNMALLLSAGLAARLSRARHLWHVREWFGEFPRMWGVYQVYMYLCADRILSVSRTVADHFHPRLRKKVRVIYDGFPDSEFQAVTPERVRAFRSAHGLEGHPAIGVVGRIKWKRKGQEVFLRAASLIRNAHPDARFLCIGSPYPGNESHRTELDHLAQGLGMGREWIMTGDVQDNLGAIAALEILVHPPSQPEPFSGAVIEAMALGKAVIGTNLGGTTEQVLPGVTGLLVPPDDPPALAEAMHGLLADRARRSEMGARGRERYLECFSWEPFYRSMLAEYSGLQRPKKE
jgi:glycosyltransferase involved in cell wall biosynthesis